MAVAAGAVPNWPRIRFYIRSAGDSVDWGQDVLLLSFRLASSSSSWLPSVRIYFSNAKSTGTGEGPWRSHGEGRVPCSPGAIERSPLTTVSEPMGINYGYAIYVLGHWEGVQCIRADG